VNTTLAITPFAYYYYVLLHAFLYIYYLSSAVFNMRGWSDENIEKLLGWIEENQELLRGAALHWMTKVKEAVFADNDNIDVKKIKSKYHNMKTSWKAAKKMQEESGFGVKEDDCTNSVNGRIFWLFANCEAAAAYLSYLEVLNKKCRFFWRLEEIFGTRPNNNPVVTADTLSSQQPLESQSQSQYNSLTLGSDDWFESELAGQQESNDRANGAVNSPGNQSEVSSPSSTSSAAPTSSVQPDVSTIASSTNSAPAPASSTSIQSRQKSSASSRRTKGDGELKRLVELNRSDLAEREEKRLKIQSDTQIEVARIQAESQERIMDKQLQIQREQNEGQQQMFQNIMASMLQIVTAVSNHTNNDSS
jgi:hypothetical protein